MTPATQATGPSPSLAAPARAAGAVELTLDPLSRAEFLAEYCERQPLVLARSQPGRFDAVLSDADVERLVCATALRTPAFRLVRDGAQLAPSEYTTNIAWRPGGFTGTVLVDRVAQQHAAGTTIVVQALHLHWHAAAVYCRELEIAFGWPVQANAYRTPASSQGFGVHHDTHDVFVLQVAGHKRWRIYEPVLELPLKPQTWSADRDGARLGEAALDITLQAGDTLYLPRGWPHEATAADADSLHITVGLHPPTRIDALRSALSDCADDVEFRRTLDAGGELPDDLLDRLTAHLTPAAVARRARRRFVDSRRPILADQLTQVRALGSLTLQSPLERRSTVIAELEHDDAGVRLRFEGKELRLPPQAAEAVGGHARGRRTVHPGRAPRPTRRRGPARPRQAARARGLRCGCSSLRISMFLS